MALNKPNDYVGPVGRQLQLNILIDTNNTNTTNWF